MKIKKILINSLVCIGLLILLVCDLKMINECKDEVYYGFKSHDYENLDVFLIPNDVDLKTLINSKDIDYYLLDKDDGYEIVLNKNNKIISFSSYCEPIGCVSWELYNQNGSYYIILKYLEDD